MISSIRASNAKQKARWEAGKEIGVTWTTFCLHEPWLAPRHCRNVIIWFSSRRGLPLWFCVHLHRVSCSCGARGADCGDGAGTGANAELQKTEDICCEHVHVGDYLPDFTLSAVNKTPLKIYLCQYCTLVLLQLLSLTLLVLIFIQKVVTVIFFK